MRVKQKRKIISRCNVYWEERTAIFQIWLNRTGTRERMNRGVPESLPPIGFFQHPVLVASPPILNRTKGKQQNKRHKEHKFLFRV